MLETVIPPLGYLRTLHGLIEDIMDARARYTGKRNLYREWSKRNGR